MTDKERKDRNLGLIISAVVHGAIFLILFFLVAWRPPNPPHPEIGIELNFGLDEQGGGQVQPEVSPSDNQLTEEQPAEEKPSISDQTPEETKSTDAETTVQPVAKTESPVVVKEEKKVQPKEKVEEIKPKEKTEEIKPKENPDAVFKKEDKKDVKSDAKNDGKNATSQGDDPNKTGDKGNPEGSLNSDALYGKQGGGGGGLALNMSGWTWADKPQIPNLPDNADGRIVFEIECDADGEIVAITTLERGLSTKAEQLLKDEIRRNALIRTSSGQVPERSKGRVVFLLKTK